MFNLGMPELIVILVIALLVFGPGKLPEMGKAMGSALQEFRRATSPEQTAGGNADSAAQSGGKAIK